jgi:hypothetical protein
VEAALLMTWFRGGSEGTDEELDKIVDYLTANFGKDKPGPKVNVNKAAASELVAALGLSKESPEAIVAYCEKNGYCKQLQEFGQRSSHRQETDRRPKGMSGIRQFEVKTYLVRFLASSRMRTPRDGLNKPQKQNRAR